MAEHAIALSSIQPKHTALILGCGPIGLAVVSILAARSTYQIIVSETSAQRREYALHFGASHVFDPRSTDIKASATALTDGAGPHVVFDCAGVPAMLCLASTVVRIHGTVVNLALYSQEASFDPNWFLFREATYKGSLSHKPKDYEAVIALIREGKLKPEKMITKKITFDRVVEEGFTALMEEQDRQVKILVEVNPQDL